MSQSRSVLTVWAVTFLVVAPGLGAQTIRGRLVDLTTGQPIPAGFVVLIGDSATEYDRALTDGAGYFQMEAPEPGAYRLKSAVIGIRSSISDAFQLAEGRTLELEFRITAIVVTLPVLEVIDERTCAGPPEAGMAAAVLWEEARKALNAVAWTERQGILRHSLALYERLLDPNTLEIEEARRWSQSGYYRGSPFATRTVESLTTAGYIQRYENEFIYYGPDATVLLSEDFASQHCFGIERGEGDRAGYVGLSFEPILSRSVPDIEGVLWLDRESAELRFLEFRYTNDPKGIKSEAVGGRVEFERLPLGPWIVRRWWIRMPILGVRERVFSDFIREAYLETIKEDGGWVTEVQTLEGSPVVRGGVATLTGNVINLRQAEPLMGARVVLVSTEFEARTDRNGEFRFDNIPEGAYRVSFGPELLDALGYVPPLVAVTLSIDKPQSVTLVIPPLSQLRSDLCPGSDPARGGIVSGFVRDSLTLRPIRGVQVLAYRAGTAANSEEQQRNRSDTMTDWAGHYRLCDLPGEMTWTIEVRRAGESGVTVRRANVTLSAGDVMRADFAIPATNGRTVP